MLRQSSMAHPHGRNDYVVTQGEGGRRTDAPAGALLAVAGCPIMGRACGTEI
jgi:hypothetical protein